MYNLRSSARRIIAASACAALLAVVAPAVGAGPESAAPGGAVASAQTTERRPATSGRTTSPAPERTSPRATEDAAATKDGDAGKADRRGESRDAERTTSESTAETTTEPAPETTRGEDSRDEFPEPLTDYGAELRDRMDEVTERIADDGGTIGLAFLDRATGEIVCNANCGESFKLASLSKVFMAEVVGYTNYTPPEKGKYAPGEGDMPVSANRDAMLRDDMIRLSDNEATEAIWSRYGRTAIIENVKERYGLSDATRPHGDWGQWSSSPLDMVMFFDGMLSGEGGMSETETDYLAELMYSLPRYSYGDADQDIGLRAGLPDERVATKGGWYDPRIRTSAGFFGEDDRFVMAALGANIAPDDLTGAVAAVFPEGHVELDRLPAPGETPVTRAASSDSVAGAVPGGGPNWILGLLAATAVGFALGWALRRTGGTD